MVTVNDTRDRAAPCARLRQNDRRDGHALLCGEVWTATYAGAQRGCVVVLSMIVNRHGYAHQKLYTKCLHTRSYHYTLSYTMGSDKKSTNSHRQSHENTGGARGDGSGGGARSKSNTPLTPPSPGHHKKHHF